MLKDAFSNLGYIPIAALCVGLLAAYQIATPNSVLTQQASECVVETLNTQEAAARQDFIKAFTSVPIGIANKVMAMQRQRESPEWLDRARQANLTRIEELCRLKFP